MQGLHYHSTKEFEYENFHNSLEAYTTFLAKNDGNTVEEDDDLLVITTIFINVDENRKPYAQYRFAEEFITNNNNGEVSEPLQLNLEKAIRYLEGSRIYLEDDKNKVFSIYKIYNSFSKEILTSDSEALKEAYLGEYFSDNVSIHETNKEYSFLEKDVYPIEPDYGPFIEAEELMIQLSIGEPESSYMFSFPIFAYGELKGVAYFLYDKTKLDLEEILKRNHELLTVMVTQEYEKNELINVLNHFGKKPRNLLAPYQNLFASLEIKGYEPFQQNGNLKSLNPYLKKLGYENYYLRYVKILEKQIDTIKIARKARLKSAIVSIIVDSFAHNTGAHSLIALKWWFENRFKIMDRSFSLIKEGQLRELTVACSDTQISHQELIGYGRENLFHSEMSRSESSLSDEDVSLTDIIHFMKPGKLREIFRLYAENDERPEDKEILEIPIPVDYALYHFFEFLRNKSAFWSGVSRDTLFSGRIRSWFQLIRIFTSNPLFLGTVAHSEGINKVNIYIEILNSEGNIIVGGEFAKINLEIIQEEDFRGGIHKSFSKKEDDLTESSSTNAREMTYRFLSEGKDYEAVSIGLKSLAPVYLPGELIGQEAFFTILENTLRNVKHYKNVMSEIQRDGINFCLSIQEVPFIRKDETPTEEKKMYKIGTWLHHEQQLYFKDKKKFDDRTVIGHQMALLKKRIVTRKGKVRLGGSNQDKVCAAMLLNNTFESVEEWDERRVKKHYFPFIYPASHKFQFLEDRKNNILEKEEIFHIVYNRTIRAKEEIDIPLDEQRRNNYSYAQKEYINMLADRENGMGILKRYFHIWKGENCKFVEGHFTPLDENLARFRILVVSKEKNDQISFEEKRAYIRKQGIIRVIENNRRLSHFKFSAIENFTAGDEDQDVFYKVAMAEWLGGWLPKSKEEILGVTLYQPEGSGPSPIGVIFAKKTYNDWDVFYKNKEEIKQAIRKEELSIEIIEKKFSSLNLAHGVNYQDLIDNPVHICKIRSHCSFNLYILGAQVEGIDDLPIIESSRVKSGKLLETLLTQITIFDNRIYNLFPMSYEIDGRPIEGSYDEIGKQLRIQVLPENGKLFDARHRKTILQHTHFLVIHISFLETIWKNYWKEPEKGRIPYNEAEVSTFFDKEIREFFIDQIRKNFPENLILVITSGRGRGDWVESVKDPQITFRPIETLIHAFEDGLSLKDDYQIKHNLCNLLFGS